jgi:hypothetical protein
MMDTISVKTMDAGVVADFETLLSKPPEGWCWCVAWEVPTWDGWGDRSAEENEALRKALWLKGEFDGYVIYENAQPIGWVRVGPTSRWPKLATSRGMELRDDLFIFTCFGMRPEKRGRGLMRDAVSQVLGNLSRRGIKEVAAIPKKTSGARVEDGEVWNGPEGLFKALGFRPVREEQTFIELRLKL